MGDEPKLPVGQERPLTPGEIEAAKTVFGNSIDYDKVRIHRGAYSKFQGEGTTMTPNGELYCRSDYADDFSKGNTHFFIHEMTHVWQYQNKLLSPLVAGAEEWVKSGFDYKSAYAYKADPKKDLTDYNLEQQADMVADYWGYKQRQKEDYKPPVLPKTPEELSKGLYGFMLKKVDEVHKKDPQDRQVKDLLAQNIITFDGEGNAHFTQHFVDTLTAGQKKFDAQQKIDDADRLQVLRKFIADPSYINPGKSPAQPVARPAPNAKPVS